MPDRADPIEAQPSEAQPAEAQSSDSTPATPERAHSARRSIDVKQIARENWRLITVLGLLALGIVFVMLGWYGAAHTNIFTEQIPYLISGGLLGLGLIIVAGILAASTASEREAAALRKEIARLAASVGTSGGSAAARYDGPAISANGHLVFAVPGGRSYHEPGCPILEGKEGVRELQPATATRDGLAACKLCAPD